MSAEAVIFLLAAVIFVLLALVACQQFAFRTETQKKLREISEKFKEILDENTDEKVMVFTGDKTLADLAAQINRLLENSQKVQIGRAHV